MLIGLQYILVDIVLVHLFHLTLLLFYFNQGSTFMDLTLGIRHWILPATG